MKETGISHDVTKTTTLLSEGLIEILKIGSIISFAVGFVLITLYLAEFLGNRYHIAITLFSCALLCVLIWYFSDWMKKQKRFYKRKTRQIHKTLLEVDRSRFADDDNGDKND